MNKSLLGYSQGRDLSPSLFGFPLGQNADSIPRTPPVTDYECWYDASVFSSLTIVSAAVSQWDDQSVNARHLTQATAGNRPVYSTRKINNIVVPDFVSNDFLDAAFDVGAEACSLFGVCAADSFATTRVLLSAQTAASHRQVYATAGTGLVTIDVSAGAGASMDSPACQPTVPFAFGITYDSTTVEFWFNKSRQSKAASLTFGSANLRVGATQTPASGWVGSMGEILLYNRTLNVVEATAIMDYLMNKWGI